MGSETGPGSTISTKLEFAENSLGMNVTFGVASAGTEGARITKSMNENTARTTGLINNNCIAHYINYNININSMIKAQRILPVNGKPTVLVDHRERASGVTRILERKNVSVRPVQLEVGDYICSDRVCLERKVISDFLNSIIDQRIFSQLENLAGSYEKPVLVLEGNPELLYLERDMHENAIRGALASIAIDYGIPIIWTQNPRETAEQIFWIAYREQVKEKREPQIRSSKRAPALSRQQEFLVAGFPHINSKLSKRLLKKFKIPKKIFTASEERLMRVDGLGREKAKKIFDLLNRRYEDDE
jgi:Fanconi anemia group M protein